MTAPCLQTGKPKPENSTNKKARVGTDRYFEGLLALVILCWCYGIIQVYPFHEEWESLKNWRKPVELDSIHGLRVKHLVEFSPYLAETIVRFLRNSPLVTLTRLFTLLIFGVLTLALVAVLGLLAYVSVTIIIVIVRVLWNRLWGKILVILAGILSITTIILLSFSPYETSSNTVNLLSDYSFCGNDGTMIGFIILQILIIALVACIFWRKDETSECTKKMAQEVKGLIEKFDDCNNIEHKDCKCIISAGLNLENLKSRTDCKCLRNTVKPISSYPFMFGAYIFLLILIVGILSASSLLILYEQNAMFPFYFMLVSSIYIVNFLQHYRRGAMSQIVSDFLSAEDNNEFTYKNSFASISSFAKYHVGTVALQATVILPLFVAVIHACRHKFRTSRTPSYCFADFILMVYLIFHVADYSVIMTATHGHDFFHAAKETFRLFTEKVPRTGRLFKIRYGSSIFLFVVLVSEIVGMYTVGYITSCVCPGFKIFSFWTLLFALANLFGNWALVVYLTILGPCIIPACTFREMLKLWNFANEDIQDLDEPVKCSKSEGVVSATLPEVKITNEAVEA